MTEKNAIPLDISSKIEYISKSEIIQHIKNYSIMLSKVYGDNIKIEVDINPKIDSLKFKITEFNL